MNCLYQAELDEVVGKDRLTTLDDQKELPYCNAVIKEVGSAFCLSVFLS